MENRDFHFRNGVLEMPQIPLELALGADPNLKRKQSGSGAHSLDIFVLLSKRDFLLFAIF